MAKATLDIVAKVRDQSSDKLKRIQTGLKRTGATAKKTGIDFTEFNRVLFSTTAFIGTFRGALTNLNEVLEKGANLERLQTQFERVLGPTGSFFQQISQFTDNAVDKFEAMRAGIQLKTLGIAKNSSDIAQLIAKSGTAAKMAGLEAGEGVKAISGFLKSGSTAQLEFLNLIARTNPALQAEMSMLEKAGGVMSKVISTQRRLQIGTQLLNAATQGYLKGGRDLADVLLDLRQNTDFLRGSFGRLLGNALKPVLESLSDMAFGLTQLLERIRSADKTLLRSIKSIFATTSALAGLILTLGTLRLTLKGLTALGFGGIPALVGGIVALSSAFFDTTNVIGKFVDILKSVGAVLLGTHQLVASFIMDSENFAKGIGKIDSSLYDFLQKKGLVKFTTNLARAIAVTTLFVRDVGKQLLEWFKQFGSYIEPVINKFTDFFNKSNPEGWSRKWFDSSEKIRQSLAKVTAGILAAVGAWKLFKLGTGLLGSIPGLGRLFGGGIGGGPKGTSTDPIYVTSAQGLATRTGTGTAVVGMGLFSRLGAKLKNLGSFITGMLSSAEGFEIGLILIGEKLKKIGSTIVNVVLKPFKALGAVFNKGMYWIGRFTGSILRVVGLLSRVTVVTTAVVAILAALKGAVQGIINKADEWKTFFKGIVDLASASFELATNFVQTNKAINSFISEIKIIGQAIFESFMEIFQLVAEGWEYIFGWLGDKAGTAGESMTELANRLREDLRAERGETPTPRQLPTPQQKPTFGITPETPTMPTTEEAKFDRISALLGTLEEDKRRQTTQAYQEAKREESAGGRGITAEEWTEIFSKGIDKSRTMRNLERNSEEQEPSLMFKSER